MGVCMVWVVENKEMQKVGTHRMVCEMYKTCVMVCLIVFCIVVLDVMEEV